MKLPPTDFEVMMHELNERFATGATRRLRWRRQQLDGIARLFEENEEQIIEAMKRDLGKPDLETYVGEIAYIKAEIRHARARFRHWMRPRRVATPLIGQPGVSRVVPEPVGVVLVIGPWNYPVQLLFAPLIAVVAAGNCAVLKPSEHAPASSALIARLVPGYLDERAIKVVEGGVPEASELLKLPFDHIFYTGGAEVARIVMRAAAEHLTPVTLELGGKSPAVIDRGADLKSAARRLAWGKFINAGQTCIAPDYVLVTPDQRDALVEEIRGQLRAMYGDDAIASGDYARIINAHHYERLRGLLSDGRTVIGGRSDAQRMMIEPTVLVDVTPDDPIMREEIFGPILPVLTVGDLDDALEFIGARDKPLAAYLFTRSKSSERKFVEAVSSGSICINDVIMFYFVPDLPFGGIGMSGIGKYHGKYGFDRFSNLKAVMRRGRWPEISVRFPPYSKLKMKLIKLLS